jgi:hypothetical protein
MATPTALLKFSQGAIIGPDGEALVVVPGTPVKIENSTSGPGSNIQSWRINLVYTPPGSSVAAVSPLAANAASNTPYAEVTPDWVPGTYRVQIYLYAGISYSGAYEQDIRDFVVPDSVHGIIFPPYQMLPPKLPLPGTGQDNEKPDELNIDGQPFGWDGMGTDGLVLTFMRKAVSGAFGGGYVYKKVVSGQTWEIPENTQALLDGRVVNDGRTILNGYMRILSRKRPPKMMPVVSQDTDVPNNCVQPIDPIDGPFTLRLRPRGKAGDPVIIVSKTDDPIPPDVTVDGQGPLIGGQPTRVINTPRETLVLVRQRGHGWEVL